MLKKAGGQEAAQRRELKVRTDKLHRTYYLGPLRTDYTTRQRTAKAALHYSLDRNALPLLSEETLASLWIEMPPPGHTTVAAQDAAALLLRTELPKHVLADVWQQALASTSHRYTHRKGRICYLEFKALLRLAGLAQVDMNLLLSESTVEAAARGRLSVAPKLRSARSVADRERMEAAVWASPPPPPLSVGSLADDASLPHALPRFDPVFPIPTTPQSTWVTFSGSDESPRDVRSLLEDIIAANAANHHSAVWRSPVASPPASVGAPAECLPPAFSLEDEHRCRWVGDQVTLIGVRGTVHLLPAAPLGSVCAMLDDAAGALAAAALYERAPAACSMSWGKRGGYAAALRGVGAPLPTPPACTPAFIAATNPDCLLLRVEVTSPPTSRTPVMSWVMGAACSPLPLRALLEKHAFVMPFRQAVELRLLLGASVPLSGIRVLLFVGDALAGGVVELQRSSHHGTWDAQRRTLRLALPSDLLPGETLSIRLRCAVSPDAEASDEARPNGVCSALVEGRIMDALVSGVLPSSAAGVTVSSVVRVQALLQGSCGKEVGLE
jgi:hypothetical protein